MNNKKAKIIIAILIFIFLGLIIFAFASPNDENGENLDNRVKQGEVDKKPSKDTEKESKDEKNGKENENTTPTEKKESKKEETPAKEEPKEEPAEEPAEEVDLAYVQAETLVKALEKMIENADELGLNPMSVKANREAIDAARLYDAAAGIEELIAEIKDADKKAELEERYAACTQILNDFGLPLTGLAEEVDNELVLEAEDIVDEEISNPVRAFYAKLDEILDDEQLAAVLAAENADEILIELLDEESFTEVEPTEDLTENGDGVYYIVVVDAAYNRSTFIATLDTVAPDVEVTYSTSDPAQEVTVTITSKNKELDKVDGWDLSENKMSLSQTFDENTDGEQEVVVSDLLGNTTTAKYSIANVDKEFTGSVTVSYSKEDMTKVTNEDITVTITAEEMLSELKDWTLSDDKMSLSRKFDENTKGSVTIKDFAGNEYAEAVSYEIANIDKVNPEISSQVQTLVEFLGFDIPGLYDVTLTFSEPVKVTYKTITKTETTKDYVTTYTINAMSVADIIDRNITIVDKAGNSASLKVELDITAPKAEVRYSTDNFAKEITVTVNANEKLKAVEGWTLSNDGKSLSKAFTANTASEQELAISDIAGNATKVKYNVTKIDNEGPVVTINGEEPNAEAPYSVYAKDVAIDATDAKAGVATKTLTKDDVEVDNTTESGSYKLVAKDKLGNTTTVSFTIDATAPDVTGVVLNGVYNTAVKPVATDDLTVTMTLSKNGGTATTLAADTTISKSGSYELVATDAVGNSTTVTFTIQDATVSVVVPETPIKTEKTTLYRYNTYNVTTTITFDEKVKLNLAEDTAIDTTKITAVDADETTGFATQFTIEGLKVNKVGKVTGEIKSVTQTLRDLTFVNEAGFEATIEDVNVILVED